MRGSPMGTDMKPEAAHGRDQPDQAPGPAQQRHDAGGAGSVDARGAMGVQVGDGNFQINYRYQLTLTDGVAPPPIVGICGVIDSPYRGLRAFGERDAAFFFGRETATTAVLERMSRQLNGMDLLMISGVSGAGKSSLLQAGVLARLRGEGLASAPGAASWPCLVLTPTHAPLDELAVRVASLTGADAVGMRRELEASPAGFALTARQAALAGLARQAGKPDGPGPAQPRLLLVVDQFEQLFTQCPDEEQRRAFISALHASATASPGQAPAALVLLGVRADFEARCADYPLLADPVQDRYLVTSMTDRQLRLAITEPAKKAGSRVNGDLVEVLLSEVNTRHPALGPALAGPGMVSGAGVLPLLSHALDQAWRNRAGDALTLADYERTGGIEGAVADSAERAYRTLTPDQRAVSRQIFTRLTATSSDGADTADRATRAELSAGRTAAGVRDVEAVLEAFAAERLLTLAADTVEISHEILLTAWHLLRDTWLAETHADRIVRTRLDNVAADWERSSRDRSYLYSGSLLQTATETVARIRADPARYPPVTQTETNFLAASDRARQRTARRRQRLIVSLVVLVVGLAAVAAAAIRAQYAAARERDDTLSASLIAQSGSALTSTNPALAKLESVAAWRLAPSSAQAYNAMLNAARLPGIAVLADEKGAVSSVAFSPDGKILAIGDRDGTVRLWDLATGRPLGSSLSSRDGPVGAVAFSPDGRTLAVGVEGYDSADAVLLWDVRTRRRIDNVLRLPSGAGFGSMAFSPDGATLVVAPSTVTPDGAVGNPAQLWQVATHRRVADVITRTSGNTYGGSDIAGSVAFSPDGKTLALGGMDGRASNNDGAAWLWNVANRHQIGRALLTGGSAVTSVAFSPNDKTLALGGGKGTGSSVTGAVWLRNVATGRQIGRTLLTGGGAVTSVAFSRSGAILATGGDDGTARLWDVASHRQIGNALSNGGGAVTSVAFSPDGAILASGDEDGTAGLWDVTTAINISAGTPVIGVPGTASSVAFSPDGKTLATGVGRRDGQGEVWLRDVATGHQLGTPLATRGAVTSVAFRHSGSILATSTGSVTTDSTGSGGVQVWKLATHRQIGSIANGGSMAKGTLSAASSVAFGHDGTILAVGGDSSVSAGYGTVWLWNVAAGHEIANLRITVGQVTSVAFRPHSMIVAARRLHRHQRQLRRSGVAAEWGYRPSARPRFGHRRRRGHLGSVQPPRHDPGYRRG